MHFQDVILTLERYWGARGCVLLQPFDAQMGAGTFHPATVLRSLGPKPWNCAYAQPSRRPADARYGENPNRLGHYYQYQVILKPSPKDVQDLYLGSLEAIGIDLRKNDVRFVEDDWESPTLGAWGLGWEVWMNGLEISQFTYFQQVGGVSCRPFPAELTYGLERLTMALQRVDNVYDLTWVDGVSYGDVYHRNEVEQSKYNFEQSDPEVLFDLFNHYFKECGRLAEAGLALPAYDYCIKTSHAFNLLDARGAISVAERAQYIKRIRELACACAQTWVDHTEGAGEPAGLVRPEPIVVTSEPTGSKELMVEVFCEELPATFVRPALDALKDGLIGLLEGIEHGEVRTYATPRRLAVVVSEVAPARPREEKLVTGPPADRAYDADGNPTKGAIGFARGKGIDVGDLEVVDTPRGKVVAARVVEGGERVDDLVAAGIEKLVLGLPFRKSMEWANGGMRWARPFHHVTVLYDGQVVPAVVGDVAVDNQTEGHRLSDRVFRFRSSHEWLENLRARHVEPDLAVREQRIAALLVEAAKSVGADPIDEPELLEEVLHLVEWPMLVVGQFDAGLLHLPPKLLVETMQHHQRYFPIYKDGVLTEHFAVISNTPHGDPEQIAAGNARVLRARFDDARFFLAEDKKKPLEEHAVHLGRMRWIRGMGTMADKQARVSALSRAIAEHFGGDGDAAARAGALCKADLATQMVQEFPKLQGHMGTLYAAAHGETDAVSAAIEEHYLPRFAEDHVAASPTGIAVALADRLDTLAGCFGIGLIPKGGDPQGLRRAALGLVNTLIAHGMRADLAQLVGLAVDQLHRSARMSDDAAYEAWNKHRGTGTEPSGRDDLVAELVAFIDTRFRARATGDGASADLVDAVLAVTASDPVVLDAKVQALKGFQGNPEFDKIQDTFKRVLNITREHDDTPPDRDDLTEDAERALHDAVVAVEDDVTTRVAELDFAGALELILGLHGTVDQFFVDLMVLDDDPAVRSRRLGLLNRVGGVFLQLADFSRITTR